MGTYVAGQIAIFVLLTSMSASSELELTNLKEAILCEAVMLPFIFCFVGWLWSMGSFLSTTVGPERKINCGPFRFATIALTLYLTVALPLFLNTNPTSEKWLFTLQLFAIVCLLYVYYFVAKTLAMINKRKEVVFRDYSKLLFLLFFSPFGVWFIQPRINQLYVEGTNV